MRIIAFGDIHMSLGNFQDIPAIDRADHIILTGDLTNYGNRQDAKIVLDQVLSVNPNVLAQYGNLDHLEINNYLEELDMNLHGQARIIDGHACFIGIGGSNVTPFNTPVEFSEEEIAKLLEKAYAQATDLISLTNNSKTPIILVAHTPPINTKLDKLPNGVHVGSSAIRKFIEDIQPTLCLTGHIHEAKGEDHIGKTPIINPGMIQEGGWIELVIEGTTAKATLS